MLSTKRSSLTKKSELLRQVGSERKSFRRYETSPMKGGKAIEESYCRYPKVVWTVPADRIVKVEPFEGSGTSEQSPRNENQPKF